MDIDECASQCIEVIDRDSAIDTLEASLAELRARLAEAERERDEALAIMSDVADSGIELDDMRIRHLLLQIDRPTWKKLLGYRKRVALPEREIKDSETFDVGFPKEGNENDRLRALNASAEKNLEKMIRAHRDAEAREYKALAELDEARAEVEQKQKTIDEAVSLLDQAMGDTDPAEIDYYEQPLMLVMHTLLGCVEGPSPKGADGVMDRLEQIEKDYELDKIRGYLSTGAAIIKKPYVDILWLVTALATVAAERDEARGELAEAERERDEARAEVARLREAIKLAVPVVQWAIEEHQFSECEYDESWQEWSVKMETARAALTPKGADGE
jgi:tetratricopeptide (TPR) repeat protein